MPTLYYRQMALVLAPLCIIASAHAAPKGTPPQKSAQGPVKIELSHQLDEARTERIEALITQFNKTHPDVELRLTRRVGQGALKEINLVTLEEKARFTLNKAKFKPLNEVMRAAKEPFDPQAFSPELRDTVTDRKGQIIALPLAYSTPVLYINKGLFRKAGLDPDHAPATWQEMQTLAGKLSQAGQSCIYTTSWPVLMFFDNMSAWNGVDISDNKGRFVFNSLIQVKHMAMMATWHKAHYLKLYGYRDEAENRFLQGECAMLTASSALFSEFSAHSNLEATVSRFPYHDDAYGAPKNTLADGASLWITDGLNPTQTKAVAKFIRYVLSPETQIKLTLAGGYLPMTPVARAASSSQLLQADLAALQIAYGQVRSRAVQPKARAAQIEAARHTLENALEDIWADRKPAKQALDDATLQANNLLSPAVGKKPAKAKGK